MTHTQSSPKKIPARLLETTLLVILLAVGAFLRFAHSDWDGGNQLHPDERGILFVAQDIELPTSLADALSPGHSTLNPFRTADGGERIYAYGHLPLYMMVFAQRLLGGLCPIIEPVCQVTPPESFAGRLLNVSSLPRFDHLTIVGRALSALFDTLTIMVTWLLARELFRDRHIGPPRMGSGGRATVGRPYGWEGILAAGLCAFAVLHIQNAHFGTVDTALALFATLAVWLLARYTRTQQHHDSALAGVCAGLALGCKASAVLLVFPIVATYLRQSARSSTEQQHRWRLRISTPKRLGLTMLAAILAFVLTNPYALLDPVPFLNSLATQAAMTSGALDWPFTRQYIGTLPLWYPIEQQARWGLGLPLTLAAYGGLIWAVWRAGQEHSRALAVVLVWAAAMLVGGSAQLVKFPRYLLPLMPTLFAFAGGMLTIPLTGESDGKKHRAVGWLRGAGIVIVVVPTILYTLAFEGMYRQPHPWVTASEWIYQMLPPGTQIAIEQGDDALPLDITLDGKLLLANTHVETCAIDPFAEPDDEAKLDRTLHCLARVDYLILASNRHYGVIPRLAGRSPLTAAYYQALFDGKLGFEPARSFERPPTLLGWSLVDDPFARARLTNPIGGWGDRAINLGPADESLTVYDHPLVLVLRNERRFPAEKMRSMIEAELESWRIRMKDGAAE